MTNVNRYHRISDRTYPNFELIVSSFLYIVFAVALDNNAHAQTETANTTSSANTTELDEIIIEEEGEPETSLPLGIGISGETLTTAPGTAGDPLRALQTLPGMNFVEDGEPTPAVRGSRPGDNYFQVDFAPLGYLFHVGGLISVFNADLVESFDIYQSAYGPEFAGVTGAVFDVKLREPKTDRFRSSIDVNLFQAGALIEGPISETQSFYLAGRISYLDLLPGDQISEEDSFKIEQFPKYTDYQGKYVWKPNASHKLTAQINGASDLAQVVVEEDAEEVENDPVFAGTTKLNGQRDEQAVVWDFQANDRLSVKSLVSHVTGKTDLKFGGAGTVDVVEREIGLKTHATYQLSNRHDVSIGAQFNKGTADIDIALALPPCAEFEPDCFATGSEKQALQEKFDYTFSRAFIKDNWYVNDRLTLYPGVAFSSSEYRNEKFVEPRVSAEYALSEQTILSAGFGQYHQSPGYLERSSVYGNPNLDFSEALHAQVGVQRLFSNGWSVKSELYYKALDNLVTTDPELTYSNDGEGHAFGLDTLIRKNLTHKLSGWASISLSESRRKDKRTSESFVFDYDQPVNRAVSNLSPIGFTHRPYVSAQERSNHGRIL